MERDRDAIHEAISRKIRVDRERWEAKLVDRTAKILGERYGLADRQIDRDHVYDAFRECLNEVAPMMADGLTMIATKWMAYPQKPLSQKLAETCDDMLSVILERNIETMDREGIIDAWRQTEGGRGE
jgi:hypothetical protein